MLKHCLILAITGTITGTLCAQSGPTQLTPHNLGGGCLPITANNALTFYQTQAALQHAQQGPGGTQVLTTISSWPALAVHSPILTSNPLLPQLVMVLVGNADPWLTLSSCGCTVHTSAEFSLFSYGARVAVPAPANLIETGWSLFPNFHRYLIPGAQPSFWWNSNTLTYNPQFTGFQMNFQAVVVDLNNLQSGGCSEPGMSVRLTDGYRVTLP